MFHIKKYSPNQPRDRAGRWIDGSGPAMDAQAVSPKDPPLTRLDTAMQRIANEPGNKARRERRASTLSQLDSLMANVKRNF